MKKILLFSAGAICSVLFCIESIKAQDLLIARIKEQKDGAVVDKLEASSGGIPTIRSIENKQSGSNEIEVLDNTGRVIYTQPFTFIRHVEVPLPEPNRNEPKIKRVRLEQPEAVVVLPRLPEGRGVRIKGSSRPVYLPTTVTTVKFNEIAPAPAQKGYFHILVIASGFSVMSDFQAKVRGIKDTLLSKEPFFSKNNKIIITAYENTTDLGCYSGCFNINRLMCCDTTKVITAATQSKLPYDEIIVIHNTPTYSGSGYRDGGSYQSDSASSFSVVYNGPWTELMALHEFGHSFGNLCDEYTYGSEGYEYSECANCRQSCSDWNNSSSSCQLGCDARSNYYRPENSVMLDYDTPFFNSPSIVNSLQPRLNYFIEIPPSVTEKHDNMLMFVPLYLKR